MPQQQRQEENTQHNSKQASASHSPWWRSHDEKKVLKTPPQPAPTRVRADELAQALRELEARGAEQVALEEALRELDPTVTSAQVMAEIREMRAAEAARTAAREGTVEARLRRRKTLARLGAAAGCILVTSGAIYSIRIQEARTLPQPQNTLSYPFRPVSSDVNLIGTQLAHVTPSMKPLLAFPENQPFRADINTLSQLRRILYGNSFIKPLPESDLKSFFLDTAPNAPQAQWQVIKQGGKFYLRAYSLGRLPDSALRAARMAQTARANYIPLTPAALQQSRQAAQVTIYNSPAAARTAAIAAPGATAPTITQVSVPIDGLDAQYSSYTTGDQSTLTTNITQLDDQAYESWQDLPPPPTTPNTPRYINSIGGSF